MKTETELAKKVRVLVDARVEAEFPHAFSYRYGWSEEDKAKKLEELCKEFLAHCRDHRSLDQIDLTVIRDYEEQCSNCHEKWETMDGEVTGTLACAYCEQQVDI